MRNKTRIRNSHIVRRISYAIERLDAARAGDRPWLEHKGLVEFLLTSGYDARKLGRRDLAYLFFDLARRLSPKNALAEIDACIELRDAGKVGPATGRLDRVLAMEPENTLALHEKGVGLFISGEVEKAHAVFEQVVALNHRHHYAWINLLRTSIATERFDKCSDLIEHIGGMDRVDRKALASLTALIAFLERHGAEITTISEDNDRRMISTADSAAVTASVVDPIRAAIAERRPFSLIRLGDGEGALLARSVFTDPTQFEDLLTANREEFLGLWFGANAHRAAQSVETLVGDLRAAIDDADLVCIPDKSGWQRELRLASPRGVPSLGAILSHTRNWSAKRLCPQIIHLALDQSGKIDVILKGLTNPIVVIGPHPGIDAYVQKRFLTPNVRAIRIPARQADLPALSYPRDERRHFPEVFEEVCETISALPQGSICLVGAGPLGKIYCARAKAHGHVAIDLGAVLDNWMNIKSRYHV